MPQSENRLAALLLLALPVFFLFLGANAIWDANEAFYVETPRQMVQSGDYVNPSFNGLPRFNKPVLSYWIVAGLYKLFGISVEVELSRRANVCCQPYSLAARRMASGWA